MKIFSVVLCAVSLWFSVKYNYTEVHREDTQVHREKGKQAHFEN